jgi:hypothetical protein
MKYLALCLLAVALSIPAVAQEDKPLSDETKALIEKAEGFEFLPFSVEKFELNSPVTTLRELDQAIGEALVVFQSARARLRIPEQLVDLGGDLADEKAEATLALRAALQRATDNAQRTGDAAGVLALHEALVQLDKGRLRASGWFLGGSADREAVKYRGHRYKLFSSDEDQVPWHVAEEMCERKGGYLACAENREEVDFLASLLDDDAEDAWVGATRPTGGGVRAWRWVTGEGVDQALWYETVGHGYDAARVHREGDLLEALSGVRWSYICEWGTALPLEWVFADSRVNKAVLSYVSAMKLATREHEEQKRKLDDKLTNARTAFRKATRKAAGKAIKQLKKSNSEAARAGLMEEIHRIDMVSVALQDERLLPDPPLRSTGAGPEAVAARAGARRFGYSAYKVIEEKLGWHDAVRRCEEWGGRLAILKTSHQEHFILEELFGDRPPVHLWLGANDEAEEGDWRWRDGSPVVYEPAVSIEGRWMGLPPDSPDYEAFPALLDNYNGVEHCLQLQVEGGRFILNDVGSHETYVFLCEWVYPQD